MDFSFSDEQQAVIELARQILSEHCTQEQLRKIEQSGEPRFDRDLWAKLAEAAANICPVRPIPVMISSKIRRTS